MSLTLVGAGPVGVTLAALLVRRGHRAVSVISRSRRSAHRAARLLGSPVASDDLHDISAKTSLVIVAVPEEELADLARRASALEHLPWRGVCVFHTSGAQTSELLKPLSDRGAMAFALHPIQSFPRGRRLHEQLSLMEGVAYAFQGPPRFAPLARRIVRDLDGTMVVVPKQRKILYHAACVFASNYPVVLLDIVEDLAKAVSPDLGLEAFRPLTESSIAHAAALSPTAALTGPVVRTSVRTVKGHRQALAAHSHEIAEIYRVLALHALRMAIRRGDVRGAGAKRLRSILRKRK